MNEGPDNPAVGLPYLEHFPEPGAALQRVYLVRFPFRLGRDQAADLVVYSSRVSKVHAAIEQQGDDVVIADQGSTNGTFVNGRRVAAATPLLDGDIIHLAKKEFRFGLSRAADMAAQRAMTESALTAAPRGLLQDVRSLRELIERQQVDALFQPIVSLAGRTVVGYEALGRGDHDQLPNSPGPLFALAGQCGLSVPLSLAFRRIALIEAAPLRPPRRLFLNVHPDELRSEQLANSLRELEALRQDWHIVVEVHEDFVADLSAFRRLHAHLRDLDIQLAYDDFGVGQARLAALAQVPADFVKLDLTIVQGLPHSRALRELVRGLVAVCADLGTRLIAEGMETEEEAAASLDVGCELGQGFLFARPQSAAQLVGQSAASALAERPAVERSQPGGHGCLDA